MLKNRREILIEWGDCDPAEIVYFPNYLKWFDNCTTGLFIAGGLPKPQLRSRFGVVGYPMVDLRTRFMIPSRFGDTVAVESEVARIGRSSFEIVHRLMRGADLAVEGHETRVLVGKHPDDPERIRSVPLPDEVVRILEGKTV